MCLNEFCGLYLVLRLVRKLSQDSINQTTCLPSDSESYRPVGTLFLQKVHKKLEKLITLDQKQSSFCGFWFFQNVNYFIVFKTTFRTLILIKKGDFLWDVSLQKAKEIPLFVWVKILILNGYSNVFFHTKRTRFTSFYNKNFILTQPEKMCLKKYFANKTRFLFKKGLDIFFSALRIG